MFSTIPKPSSTSNLNNIDQTFSSFTSSLILEPLVSYLNIKYELNLTIEELLGALKLPYTPTPITSGQVMGSGSGGGTVVKQPPMSPYLKNTHVQLTPTGDGKTRKVAARKKQLVADPNAKPCIYQFKRGGENKKGTQCGKPSVEFGYCKNCKDLKSVKAELESQKNNNNTVGNYTNMNNAFMTPKYPPKNIVINQDNTAQKEVQINIEAHPIKDRPNCFETNLDKFIIRATPDNDMIAIAYNNGTEEVPLTEEQKVRAKSLGMCVVRDDEVMKYLSPTFNNEGEGAVEEPDDDEDDDREDEDEGREDDDDEEDKPVNNIPQVRPSYPQPSKQPITRALTVPAIPLMRK